MIWRPKPGQRVILKYSPKKRQFIHHHGVIGVVVKASKGRKMVNALVDTSKGLMVVPGGHLYQREDIA